MGGRIDNAIILGAVIMSILISLMGNSAFVALLAFGFIGIVIWATNKNFSFNNKNNPRTKSASRLTALESVRLYLAPHNSIWKNLRVSNKFCTMRLGADGYTITITEKTDTNYYRRFKIVESKVHTLPELWDMFCLNFDHLTSYNGLRELCNTFRAIYKEETIGETPQQQTNIVRQTTIKTDSLKTDEKLDINNASEVEITALPGISIVLSKKIIKKREEIGGFKTVDDVFLFLKLKPHMENQLRNLICVKKMKGSVKIQRTTERSIDL